MSSDLFGPIAVQLPPFQPSSALRAAMEREARMWGFTGVFELRERIHNDGLALMGRKDECKSAADHLAISDTPETREAFTDAHRKYRDSLVDVARRRSFDFYRKQIRQLDRPDLDRECTEALDKLLDGE